MLSIRYSLVVACIVTIGMFGGCRQSAGREPYEDILLKNLDTTVSPARDFFSYANGGWVKKNPIPASESRWGIGNLVQEETYARLREVSGAAAKDSAAAPMSIPQKIGDFYFTAIDTAGIEQNGIRPLQPELDRIKSITNFRGLLNEIALLQTYQVDVLFTIPVYQDQMNSDKMAVYLAQGGLGLPNRDYYFNTDARTGNIRREYVAHVSRMFRLLGEDSVSAGRQGSVVMKIETALASKSRTLADLRDPYRNYNKMSVTEAGKLTSRIDWPGILTNVGVRNPDTVIVGQPEFFREVNRLLSAVGIEDWKVYLRWHLVHAFADKLGRKFDDENFRFYGTILDGKTEQRARWKRALDAEESAMGELLGQMYVKKYFPPSTKQRYETLVNNIIDVYRERIGALDWMSPETKAKAREKLSTVVKKVGYPDKWKDYSALSINRESYVMNVLRANVWAFNYQVGKLGKPVDRTEWDMTPQTYNAYYNPSNNEIVLPAAAFIIPGLPDSLADDALVYAYAGGSTIGHELTHGFDDEGRQYDAKGNLKDWWTKEDEKKFNERAHLMEVQFNQYVVLDTMHVNGKACLGENIADLGGILLGYDAFRRTEQAKSGTTISGMTPDQRYFLGYALSWLSHQRDQRLARQILTDVHSPAFLRVNGPLSDISEFYTAFGVKPGDPMYRPDSLRVMIW